MDYGVGDPPYTVTTTSEPSVLNANKCYDCFQTVWVFWDRMLSNFPPLQFRRRADLEKDENQDEAHTSTIAIAMKTATKWHLFLRQKI